MIIAPSRFQASAFYFFLKRSWLFALKAGYFIYSNIKNHNKKKNDFETYDSSFIQMPQHPPKVSSSKHASKSRVYLLLQIVYLLSAILIINNASQLGVKLFSYDKTSRGNRNIRAQLNPTMTYDRTHSKLIYPSEESRSVLSSKSSSLSTLFAIFQDENSNESIDTPDPLQDQKVSVFIMNYSRPRMIQESTLMKTLIHHPNVGEIILLHANPKTLFEYIHEKVINIDATEANDSMGLSLRFYYSQMATYDWILHVDDDMEFEPEVISEMLLEFQKNTKRIVGRFGRNMNEQKQSIWNLSGQLYNGYNSQDTHLRSDIILTKFMIMERELSQYFFEYAHLIWDDIVLKQGEGPLWNGEDIFMSLVANKFYGTKNNYAMDWLEVRDAPESLKDYEFGELDISGGHSGLKFWSWKWWQSFLRRNRHYSYRGMLWQVAELRLNVLSYHGFVEGVDGLHSTEELDKLRI